MMKKGLILSLVVLMLSLSVGESLGKENADAGAEVAHVYAIQNRVFHCSHELDANGGYSSGDDFYQLYPLGLSYIFHFSDHLAWEVARGSFILSEEKTLRDDLKKKFGAAPVDFPKPKYMAHSHLMIKPLYGKDAVWNGNLINHEGYLFLGGGLISYEMQPDGFTENVLSVSFGLGTKYFVNRRICVNLEIQNLLNFREERTEYRINFGLGFGVRFNLAPRKTEQSESVTILNHYLKEDERP